MSEFIEINNHKIGLGEQQAVELKLARLPSFQPIELPVYVFRAEEEGPVLLLTGGMHGDEINGIEIIRRMIRQKVIVPETGSVIAVPLINIFGFIQRQRDMPDGKDINRSFPGSKNGSLARLVAHTLMKQIFPQIDYGVDFHTGGDARINYPQVRCKLEVPKNRELAQAFAPPIVVNSSFVEHSFRQAAHKKGKQILVFESGEANRFYESGIKAGIEGTLRLMKYLGMRSEAAENDKVNTFNKSSWVRADSAGMFHSAINLGETVDRKQVLGFISDPYGKENIKVKSPRTGCVMGLNRAPVIHKGDALIHIAYNK